MISHHIIGLFKLDVLTLKNFNSFMKLINLQFDIRIFLSVFSVMIIFVSEFSLEIV